MFSGRRLNDGRGTPPQDVQRCEVFLRETILLVAPLVKAHTTMVRARLAAKESHTVFGRSVTRSHNVSSAPRRRGAINGTNAPHGVLLPVVGDIESDDRSLAVGGCPFDDHDLRYLPVLAKVFVGA